MILALLALAVVAVSLLYPVWIDDRIGLLLMLPVLAYSLWYFINWQWAGLGLSLAFLLGGFLLGNALLVLGLPISSGRVVSYIKESVAGLKFIVSVSWLTAGQVALSQLVIIIYEELIWRVFLLSLLPQWMPIWAAVLVASALFTYVHVENRDLGWHSVEFLLFACVLSVIYLQTNSLIMVCAVHAGRNLLILGNGWYQSELTSR